MNEVVTVPKIINDAPGLTCTCKRPVKLGLTSEDNYGLYTVLFWEGCCECGLNWHVEHSREAPETVRLQGIEASVS